MERGMLYTNNLASSELYAKMVDEIRMICKAWGLDPNDPHDVQIVVGKVISVALGISKEEGPPESESESR